MKAAFLEKLGQLTVREVARPELEPGSVLVRVRACTICATDLRIYHYGHSRIQLPHVLGHEIAGEIASATNGTGAYRIGERVAVTPHIPCGTCFYCRHGEPGYCTNRVTFGYQLPGGFAEYLLVPAGAIQSGGLNRFPGTVSFAEATLAEPLSCCLRGQRLANLKAGDTVVVIGGGPIGLMHCRLARFLGADKIILIGKNLKRLEKVNLGGIDHLIDAAGHRTLEEVHTITEGRGAEVVIVACSVRQAQEESLTYAAPGGRINLFGGLPPNEPPIRVDSNLIHYRELRLTGSHGSTKEEIQQALRLIVDKKLALSDLISDTFSLNEIRQAFALADSRQGMKVTVCP